MRDAEARQARGITGDRGEVMLAIKALGARARAGRHQEELDLRRDADGIANALAQYRVVEVSGSTFETIEAGKKTGTWALFRNGENVGSYEVGVNLPKASLGAMRLFADEIVAVTEAFSAQVEAEALAASNRGDLVQSLLLAAARQDQTAEQLRLVATTLASADQGGSGSVTAAGGTYSYSIERSISVFARRYLVVSVPTGERYAIGTDVFGFEGLRDDDGIDLSAQKAPNEVVRRLSGVITEIAERFLATETAQLDAQARDIVTAQAALQAATELARVSPGITEPTVVKSRPEVDELRQLLGDFATITGPRRLGTLFGDSFRVENQGKSGGSRWVITRSGGSRLIVGDPGESEFRGFGVAATDEQLIQLAPRFGSVLELQGDIFGAPDYAREVRALADRLSPAPVPDRLATEPVTVAAIALAQEFEGATEDLRKIFERERELQSSAASLAEPGGLTIEEFIARIVRELVSNPTPVYQNPFRAVRLYEGETAIRAAEGLAQAIDRETEEITFDGVPYSIRRVQGKLYVAAGAELLTTDTPYDKVFVSTLKRWEDYFNYIAFALTKAPTRTVVRPAQNGAELRARCRAVSDPLMRADAIADAVGTELGPVIEVALGARFYQVVGVDGCFVLTSVSIATALTSDPERRRAASTAGYLSITGETPTLAVDLESVVEQCAKALDVSARGRNGQGLA